VTSGCSCGCGNGTGCGEGPPVTPYAIDNAPAQPVLAARIGTFESFRRTMLEALGTRTDLVQLTTRDSDDASVSLVEQAAAVADVLTFYTERYTNEAYLGTAVLDTDVRRLVGLIGYRPAPGLSATTTLCLTLEAGAAFTVEAGFGVQSVPGPGETPQDFETLADLPADARLNALIARPTQAGVQPFARTAGAVVYPPDATIAGRLTVGERVLLVRGGTPGAVVGTELESVTPERDRVRLKFAGRLSGGGTRGFLAGRPLRLFGWDAPDAAPPRATVDSTVPGGVRWTYAETTHFALTTGNTITLDRVHEDLPVGAVLLVHDATWTGVVTVTAAVTVQADLRTTSSPSAVVRAGPATRLTVDHTLPAFADRRLVTVVELGDELPVAEVDDTTLGTEVWIADGELSTADLPDGRPVVLVDEAGQAVATAVGTGGRVEHFGATRFLVVPLTATAAELAVLDPATLVLCGNAVAAGHGKTVIGEVVGSADARVPFQRFLLAKAPLSRVPTATIEGSTPALTLRVDGLSWPVADQLLSSGPRDEVIALRTADDGRTIVQFGDGEHGERPASGTDNIVGTYRFGAGLAGRVRAGTLSNASAKPPGLRALTNPVPGEGGADPEPAADLRSRAPGTVRVFGRTVSSRDYADLLLSTGAVAKAQSAQVWDGHGLVLAVTVAPAGGGTLSDSSLALLAGTDKAAGTPYRRVVVGNARTVPLSVALTVEVDPRADADTVLAAVRASVLAAFDFDAVDLAAHVPLSDVYRVAQPVSGVSTVNVTAFGFARATGTSAADWAAFLAAHGDTGAATPEWLRLLGVRCTGGVIAHAELATLADADLTIALATAASVFAGGLT
jgi:hypothetical protein